MPRIWYRFLIKKPIAKRDKECATLQFGTELLSINIPIEIKTIDVNVLKTNQVRWDLNQIQFERTVWLLKVRSDLRFQVVLWVVLSTQL
jgi:hypothetical protein